MADEAYISFEQAAERLGIDEDQLLDLVASNELQAVRVNRETKFKEADIEAYASREVDTNVSLDSVDLEDLPDDIVLLGGKTPPGGFSEPASDTPAEPLRDETGELLDADDAGVVLLPDESDVLESALDVEDEPAPMPSAVQSPPPIPTSETVTPAEALDSETSDFLADLEEEASGAEFVSDESDSIFDVDEDMLDAGALPVVGGDEADDAPPPFTEDEAKPEAEAFIAADPEAEDVRNQEAEGGGAAFLDAKVGKKSDFAPDELKESDEVGEIDLEETVQESGDAEAEIPMTDHDEFDDETEPLMDAPDDSDGLGTEEILFDDEDLEIGDDGFGIGTEEATIQEDILIDDEEEEKTLLVDGDDEEATFVADEEEEDDETEDLEGGSRSSSRRSSGRVSKRSSVSSMRRRPTMSAGKSSEQASNLIWAGLMMILVVCMAYPLFLYGLIIWKGSTDSAESFASIDFSDRAILKNVGPIVEHDWFEWFPRWELGENKEQPRAWWGYPPRFSEQVTNPGDPDRFVPVEERIGQQTVRVPVGGAAGSDSVQDGADEVEVEVEVEDGSQPDGESEGEGEEDFTNWG